MRLVKIDDLNGSEVLAVPIMSAKDQVLIQSDTVLRGEYIDKLRKYNIPSVYIKDDVKFDVEETLQKRLLRVYLSVIFINIMMN